MRRLTDRFREQQALGRSRRENAAAAAFLHQEFVILFRDEPQQRQLESVLAAGLAVTAPAVAIQLGENRHDLVGEVHRHVLRDAGHMHR